MYIKDFFNWIGVKINIDAEPVNTVRLRPGEIRWCSVGVNIGSEIDGKGTSFTRPVVIVKVIGRNIALVVPLSTTTNNPIGYVDFKVKGARQKLCVVHTKTVSQKRIYDRIEKISDTRLMQVKDEIKNFFEL